MFYEQTTMDETKGGPRTSDLVRKNTKTVQVTFGGIRLELGVKKNGVDFRYVIEKSLVDFMARKNGKP